MNTYWIYIALSFVLSMLSGFMLMPRITDFCLKRKLYDMPNERKVHHNAIPRLGGVAFMPCMLLAFLVSIYVFRSVTNGLPITISLWTTAFIASLFMIYIIGLVDDMVGLGARLKFIVQIVAAAILPICNLYINDMYGFCGVGEVSFAVGAFLTVLGIVYISNAINLIDGIDGLSGGLSLIALTGFLVCFARDGVWTYCVLIAGLMGVLCAYLYFNVWGSVEKRRKIFMGDSGSLTLGFILGFLVVKFAMNPGDTAHYHNNGLLVGYTLLIVPCFDLVRVFFSRIRAHQGVFVPDKRHIHHKLLRLGLSQHKALVVILLLQLFFCAANVFMSQCMSLTWIVVADVALFTAFHLWLNVIICRKEAVDSDC